MGSLGRIDGNIQLLKFACTLKEIDFVLDLSGGQENPLLGNTESHRKQGLQVCLFYLVTQAGDFTSRGHFHTQKRVRSLESGEGELGCLDADKVKLEGRLCRWVYFFTEHRPDRVIDEVFLEDLRDEGEGTGCSQVALDHLDVIVTGDELNVVRSRDVESFCDQTGDLLDPA